MSDTITLKILTENEKGDKSKLAINAIINESQLAEIMKLLVQTEANKSSAQAAQKPKFGGPTSLV